MDASVAIARSQIPADLIEAYRDAVYRVATLEAAFDLRVDQHSRELAALYRVHATDCGSFLTAYNPLSQPRAPEVNREANRRLRLDLEQQALAIYSSMGDDEPGDGPEEPGFLALGLSSRQACALGTSYEQNAVLWAGPDAVPRLVLLR